MEVIIKGTKEEIKELLAEIRKREYITVPLNYCENPKPWWATETTPIRTITRPEDIQTTYTTSVMKGGTE